MFFLAMYARNLVSDRVLARALAIHSQFLFLQLFPVDLYLTYKLLVLNTSLRVKVLSGLFGMN